MKTVIDCEFDANIDKTRKLIQGIDHINVYHYTDESIDELAFQFFLNEKKEDDIYFAIKINDLFRILEKIILERD